MPEKSESQPQVQLELNADLKAELFKLLAPTNRGILASESQRSLIEAAVARLETLNPTAQPTSAASLLDGDWRLLYTTSQELLGTDRVPVVQLGNIYQCVRAQASRIYNIAEVQGLPYLESIISVVASFEPAAKAETDDSYQQLKRRVNVKFNRAVWGLQRSLGYQSPAQYIQQLEQTQKLNWLKGIDFEINADRQQGWLEITYLDEDLRIGRGNQGSLFVLTK